MRDEAENSTAVDVARARRSGGRRVCVGLHSGVDDPTVQGANVRRVESRVHAA